MTAADPFRTRATLEVAGRRALYHSLDALDQTGVGHLDRLPFSIRILLENALRHLGHGFVTEEHVRAIANWTPDAAGKREIPFMPARVVLQDFTGVPCVVDLAAMRDAMARMGWRPGPDQPGGAVRPGDRPLRPGRPVRLGRGIQATTSRWNSSATPSAISCSSSPSGRSRTSAWCRQAPASSTR